MEVHENPARALSDGPNAYKLSRLKSLLKRLLQVQRAAHPASATRR
jgi:3-deoxy-D-manno-octulosonic acid (KDO) 8-phosphate synthase